MVLIQVNLNCTDKSSISLKPFLGGNSMQVDQDKIEEIDKIKSLGDLFSWRVAQTPSREAYRHYSAAGKWVSLSWTEIGQKVETWRKAFVAQNLPPASRVAVLLPNGIDGVCVDQACQALGLVPVPMHAIDNPASIAYILQDSGASVFVVEKAKQWEAVLAVGNSLPDLKLVVVAAGDVKLEQTGSEQATLMDANTWLAKSAEMMGGTKVAVQESD
jgi:long-chain acyl-CoA synthetase